MKIDPANAFSGVLKFLMSARLVFWLMPALMALLVAGTVAKKLAPVLKQVYLQMAEPRWVIAIGACASSGGIFDSYPVLQGIDQVIPVDVYVSGCPPRPEAILDGILKLQDLVQNESLRRRNSEPYKALLNSYGIE